MPEVGLYLPPKAWMSTTVLLELVTSPAPKPLLGWGGDQAKRGQCLKQPVWLLGKPEHPHPEVHLRLTGRQICQICAITCGWRAHSLYSGFPHDRRSDLLFRTPGTCSPKRQVLRHMIIPWANLCNCSEQVPPCRLMHATTVELSVLTKT